MMTEKRYWWVIVVALSMYVWSMAGCLTLDLESKVPVVVGEDADGNPIIAYLTDRGRGKSFGGNRLEQIVANREVHMEGANEAYMAKNTEGKVQGLQGEGIASIITATGTAASGVAETLLPALMPAPEPAPPPVTVEVLPE